MRFSTSRRAAPSTAFEGESSTGSYTSDTSASTFTTGTINIAAATTNIVIMCGSNQTAARTISSVQVTFDGGSPVSATQLVTTGGSSTTPQGIYIIAVTGQSSYTITVTFSGTVRGAAIAWVEFPDFTAGLGTASYTEVVNGTAPLSSASHTQTQNEVVAAFATHRGAGTITMEGSTNGNLTYQSRTGSFFYNTPLGDIGTTMDVDWSAPSLPEFVVAYIT